MNATWCSSSFRFVVHELIVIRTTHEAVILINQKPHSYLGPSDEAQRCFSCSVVELLIYAAGGLSAPQFSSAFKQITILVMNTSSIALDISKLPIPILMGIVGGVFVLIGAGYVLAKISKK